MNLSTPVEKIPHVGPAYQKRLKRLNIKNVGDLLFHFPHRYEDFSNLVPIIEAEEGGPVTVQGEITDIRSFRAFRKRMTLTQITVADESGKIKALWFNQPYLVNTFKKGSFVCLAGKIKGKKSARYFSNPAYERLPENFKEKSFDLTHTGGLIPVYPETEGLSSKWLRFIVKPILSKIEQLPDSLPSKIIKKYGFLPLKKALWQIHFPDSYAESQKARKRFSFEELFVLTIFILREKMKLAQEKSITVPANIPLIKGFTEKLPFRLTDAQRKSSWQILKDMEKPKPMNRLLEGDVGSGKTIVAAIAALNVIKAGYQVAFMAPTEILAKQHHKTMSDTLKEYKIKIGLITGKESCIGSTKVSRKEIVQAASSGEVDILIGTHAIIQDYYPSTPKKTPVLFENLALVIIDEQHRFGTEQRAKLCKPRANGKNRKKKLVPHLLSMTATPIPRTLSLTIYGDLDLSLIDQLPRGRKKIITKIVQPKEKTKTYEFIKKQVKEGRQIFVICPRIDPPKPPSENSGRQDMLLDMRNLSWMDVKAVKQEYEKLSKDIFPDLKIAMLHGKMKSKEKENIMWEFKEKLIDILVSTSVVEVGVDIPNASVMMIEGSDKFGLAQLHQFRGRVGRAEHQSYCFLFTDQEGIVFNRRLKALVNCDDGFQLAEKDLAIRGPGDFWGQRQWGVPDIAMDALKDLSLVEEVREEAKEVLEKSPSLKEYPQLKKKLEEFQKNIHLE